MADQTAADVFVERLIEWGVDTIFGLPGDGINGFMEALRKSNDRIRYLHVLPRGSTRNRRPPSRFRPPLERWPWAAPSLEP